MSDNMTIGQRAYDLVVGWVASVAGASGLTVQWLTDFGSVSLIVANLVLAVGGAILLYRRLQLVSVERRLVEAKLKKIEGDE